MADDRDKLDGPWLRIALALEQGPRTLRGLQCLFARRGHRNIRQNLKIMGVVGLVAHEGTSYALTAKGRSQLPGDLIDDANKRISSTVGTPTDPEKP